MGLFNLLFKRPPLEESKIPHQSDVAENSSDNQPEPEYKPTKDELIAQKAVDEDIAKYGSIAAVSNIYDEQYKRLVAASEDYEEDGDVGKIISVYEDVLIDGKVFMRPQSQVLKLISLYKKANLNDKAWSYTNYMMMHGMAPDWKIYIEQAKLLKSEKKYEEAVRMYMFAYNARKDSLPSYVFERDKFLKDINTCAKKLNWSEEKKDRVADVLKNAITDNLDIRTMDNVVKEELSRKE